MLNDLKDHLFAQRSATVFAILDGAMIPELPAALEAGNEEYFCLYRGRLEPEMAAVAPYLALLHPGAPFTDWVLSNVWGRRRGMFGGSNDGMPELRKHFRRLAMVSDQEGKLYYFRFYDPAVLRNYLSRVTAKEAADLFGPVQWFFVEDAEPGMARRFFLVDNALRDDRIAVVQPRERLEVMSWKLESR
jgi:hypothetical protein